MKKVLFSAVLLVLTKLSFSQDVKFGIKAGLNLPKLESKDEGISVKSQSTVNFQVGGFADLGFGNFSVQPGLTLSGKGGKYEFGDSKIERNLMYLEIPVNAYYNIPVGPVKIFLGAGPYAAFGLAGKDKAEGSIMGESIDEEMDVEFGSGEEETKRADFGLNFGGGVRLNSGLMVGANYGLGLSNVSNDDESTTKNRVWSFTVGFSF